MKKQFEQADLFKILAPAIESRARFFQKFKIVRARPAAVGERIVTETSDGKETENTANAGDWVVKNDTAAAEQYIVSAEKMAQRYLYIKDAGDGWQLFKPVGQTRALELEADWMKSLGLGTSFFFTAPWGEKMVAKSGDFLAINTDQTVYRIARKEFFETYEAV